MAETSLTIDGVRAVIDSGLARIARFDPHRGINTLLVEKISRASAHQRLGRAGRTASGHGVRLWTEREHAARAVQTPPEIRRLELSGALLGLKASGIDDLGAFPWVEAPEAKSFARGLELLHDLGALDHQEKLTETGRRMAAFPTHPRYARMLLAADGLGCVRAAALIAALSQSRPILLRSDGKRMDELREDILGGEGTSDQFTLMRAFRFAQGRNFDPQKCRQLGIHAGGAREVSAALDQLVRLAERAGLDVAEKPAASDAIQRCVLTGFSDQLARRVDRGTLRCRLVHHRVGELARESGVREAELFVAGEIREVQSRDELRVLLSQATAVKEEWLCELFPGDFSEGEETVFDPMARRVVARSTRLFRDLVVDFVERDAADLDAAAASADRRGDGRPTAAEELERRRRTVARPTRLPARMDARARRCPSWTRRRVARSSRRSATARSPTSKSRMPKSGPRCVAGSPRRCSAQLDQFAPERFELPGGRKAKIIYTPGSAPMTAARIQDLYGVTNLAIAKGRATLTIQVLAPNNRARPDHQRPRQFLEGELPEDQAGARPQISEARVAVRGS